MVLEKRLSMDFLCYMACFFTYRKYKYMVMIYLVYQLDEYVGGGGIIGDDI